MRPPQVDVWFRNVKFYANELAELGVTNTVWNKFQAARAQVDPVVFSKMKFGHGSGWQTLVIDEWDAVLWKDGQDKPAAVFPVWNAQDSIEDLWRLIDKPWGANLNMCLDIEVDEIHRPVWQQKHIIVITGLGSMRDPMWRNLLDDLSDIQANRDDVTFHMNLLNEYNTIFGRSFKMADYDARITAAKGKIIIPAGRSIEPTMLVGREYWAKILGFSVAQLKVPRNRCLYNIKSAIWAARHYKGLERFSNFKGSKNPDWKSPDLEVELSTNNYIMTGRQVPKPGDKIACDHCSLWASCKFYRAKAVCGVPESEMKGVAALFKTRDSGDIIKAMGKLLAVQADRIEVGLDNEAKTMPEEGSGIDPALSKLINDTMANAEKLAKLIDPRLTPAGAKVQINMQGGSAEIGTGGGEASDPRALSRILIDQIEATGIPRDKITPEMITAAAQALKGDSGPLVIEGSAE